MEEQPLDQMPAEKPAHNEPQHNQASQVFLFVGTGLIVIAMAVIIFASWSSFSPMNRILVTLLPLLFLYILGFSAWASGKQAKLGRYTIMAGSIIFPLVLGILIYQSKALTDVNSYFFTVVGAISLAWYIFLEIGLGQEEHAPLTVIAGLVTALALADVLNASSSAYSLIAILTGAFFLLMHWPIEHRDPKSWRGLIYALAGTLVGWFGLVSLPSTLIAGSSGFLVAFFFLPISLVFFLIAITYSQAWNEDRSRERFLMIRQVAEHSSAVLFAGPMALVIWDHPDFVIVTALLALGLGVCSVALSYFIRVITLRFVGWFAIVLGAFGIIGTAFSSISAAWPLVFLAIGLLFVIAAFLLPKYPIHLAMHKLVAQPEESLFNLGINPEGSRGLLPAYHGVRTVSRGWNTCCLILFLIWFIPAAVGWLFSLLFW